MWQTMGRQAARTESPTGVGTSVACKRRDAHRSSAHHVLCLRKTKSRRPSHGGLAHMGACRNYRSVRFAQARNSCREKMCTGFGLSAGRTSRELAASRSHVTARGFAPPPSSKMKMVDSGIAWMQFRYRYGNFSSTLPAGLLDQVGPRHHYKTLTLQHIANDILQGVSRRVGVAA